MFTKQLHFLLTLAFLALHFQTTSKHNKIYKNRITWNHVHNPYIWDKVLFVQYLGI